MSPSLTSMYYKDKLQALADVFGTTDIDLDDECLLVKGIRYPIVNDVIVLVEPAKYRSVG